jgi:hypothetical protein
MQQKFRNADLYNVLPRILGPLLYTYLNLLSGVDEVSGQSWQLITATLLMMKVIVWHFVRNPHKVMTALVMICCCEDFSAIAIDISQEYGKYKLEAASFLGNHIIVKGTQRCALWCRLLTVDMVYQCDSRTCGVWQHLNCVVISDKPSEGVKPEIPSSFYCDLCRITHCDPYEHLSNSSSSF